jgi:dipeptidyl aminopeptidase/acylaminoacyl peptidase
MIQYLVNHDYVVLGVNYRGSLGYGKSFRSADDRKHGVEPLWDCIEAKKYLASFDFIEPSKIGIIGESYGGYMVLAALAFQPGVFAAGVDLFGVSNWLRMLETLPSHSKPLANFLFGKIGDPKTDAEMLKNISPLFHAHRINKPLMVLQGTNDQSVARIQSDEIVEAVRRNRGVVEYLVFDDEGHGLNKKHNQIRAYENILKFLNRYLKRGERQEPTYVDETSFPHNVL